MTTSTDIDDIALTKITVDHVTKMVQDLVEARKLYNDEDLQHFREMIEDEKRFYREEVEKESFDLSYKELIRFRKVQKYQKKIKLAGKLKGMGNIISRSNFAMRI